MRNKRIIIALIALLIMLFVTLLIIIFNIINKNKHNNNQNENENDIIIQNENIVNHDYDENVYYEENGIHYSTSGEPKDGIDFELKGIPDEVFKFIKDQNAFYATMNTYAFAYGFYKKANIATYNRYEYQKESNRLAIEFILNDDIKTTFVAIVNLKDETIEIINK